MKKLLLLILVAVLYGLCGCAGTGLTTSEKNALTGGAVGAAGGAVIGAIGGNPALGAAVGGAVGTATGALWKDIKKQMQGQ